MNCCFMNFHEQENAQDLAKHFDKEIEIAIGRGCNRFYTGTKYPEDEIFAQRVNKIKKLYAPDEITLIRITEPVDDKLKDLFIELANWETYSYET